MPISDFPSISTSVLVCVCVCVCVCARVSTRTTILNQGCNGMTLLSLHEQSDRETTYPLPSPSSSPHTHTHMHTPTHIQTHKIHTFIIYFYTRTLSCTYTLTHIRSFHQMMNQLYIREGDIVVVKNVSLQLAKFSKFQPQTVDFLDITNPKAVYPLFQ